MSGHSKATGPAVPTDQQRRQLRVTLVGYAVALLVIGALVYELYAQRVAARAAVKKLACFAVEYAPDTNQTVRDIRQFYGCPPPKPLPVHHPVKTPTPQQAPRVTVTVHGQAPAAPTAPVPSSSLSPAAVTQPAANPTRPAPSSSVASASSSTDLPSLGGIVCNLLELPPC